MSKERPILFSGPMVRALLDGSKTQTRRVCKPDANLSAVVEVPDPMERGQVYNGSHFGDEEGEVQFACPYGGRGDRLWVRETWQGPLLQEFEVDADPDWHYASHIHQYQNPAHCEYAADGGPKPEYTDADDVMRQGWRPSIHMPRWASRITLEITSVRVERLQDISEADAKAEGIFPHIRGGWHWLKHDSSNPCDWNQFGYKTAALAFQALWESINGPDSWAANPWVWAIEFRRLP